VKTMNTDNENKYLPGTSHLVDYAIDHYGAEVIEEEYHPDIRPPFPCITGASNTSDSYKIDKKLYPNIVAAGVDSLELNCGINQYIKPEAFQQIANAQSDAISAEYKGRKGVAVDWFGEQFMVLPRGSTGGYKYLLKNGDITLQIMPDARGGKTSPEIRAILRSEYLWSKGDIQAYNSLIEFLNRIAYLEYCRVSRADLCVDMLIPLPEINRKTQIVSRLRQKDLFFGGDFIRGQRDTGYQIGRKGMILCRFYDKPYEISIKGQGHILPIWEANGREGDSSVSRLELQLRRNGLRRFDPVMDFSTFLELKSDIWAFGTDKFLRIVNPDSATRKERAKVTDYWKDFQDCALLFGQRRGILPYKQTSKEWRPLVKQSGGCLASAWARIAAKEGDELATRILELECGHRIPRKIIEAGLLQKARYAHLS
jgi:hypothetical protein